jgi:uncharacterized protein involved in type VI secretion and phage assembly
MPRTYFGKYRGVVSNIQDPLLIGRIKAKVSDVYGDNESGWATPCAPFGGQGMGFFALPAVGAGVWIEFEQGDPEHPIWSGCWFGVMAEVPAVLLAPPYKRTLIQTSAGHTILIDDTPGNGGITLATADGAQIIMNAMGIQLSNGKGASITLQGPQVILNDGALEVT